MPTITQFTRFKSDKAEEMVKTAKQAKAIFEKHGAEFLRMSRFHTGMWAGEWFDCHALRQLGSVWQDAGEGSKRPGICEAVCTYSYLCRTNGPQHQRRRRSLTAP